MNAYQYVAWLRGINVGKKMVKMELLRTAFEERGYKEVKTLLNSGNVIFTTNKENKSYIQNEIEDILEKTFGFHIDVILRTRAEIAELVESDPFATVSVTPQTRLYVTFLSDKPVSKLKIPYLSPDKNFTILSVSNGEICSVLTLSDKTNTTDAMNILGKEFGKLITTRNWNTVLKVNALFTSTSN